MANQNYEFLDRSGTKKVYKTIIAQIKAAEGRCLSSSDGTVVKTVNGKIPAEKLPSYVDDILEFTDFVDISAQQAAAEAAGQDGPTTTNIAPASGVAYTIVFDEGTDQFYARTLTSGDEPDEYGNNVKYHSLWLDPENVWDLTVSGTATAKDGKLYYCSSQEKLYRWVPAVGGGGNMLDITSKSIYASGVDSDEKTTVAIGNLPAGKTASELKAMTISELFDNILFKDENPNTSSLYSVDISIDPSFSGVQLLGSLAPQTTGTPPEIEGSFAQVASNFKIPGETDNQGNPVYPKFTGGKVANSDEFSCKKNSESYSTELPTLYDVVGTFTYKYEVDYSAGETIYTKRGKVYDMAPTDANSTVKPAGTASATKTVKVTYPLYANGVLDEKSASNISTAIDGVADVKGNSSANAIGAVSMIGIVDVVTVGDDDKGVVISYVDNTGNGEMMSFEYPHALKPGKGIAVAVAVDGKWKKLESDSYTIQESVKTRYCHNGDWSDTRTDQDDLSLAFDVFTMKVRTGATSIRFKFYNL